MNAKINDVQKQIGKKKKAKEDADDLIQEKTKLDAEKKALIDSAAEKEVALNRKLKTIGNIIHETVPVEQDEVYFSSQHANV
jgi:seryl-tRNA synthetase